MKRNTWLLIPLLMVGCATTKPERPPIEAKRTYHAPFDKVWAATVGILSEDYPVKVIEKSSGLISTEFVSGSVLTYGYAPSVFLGTWSSGRHRVTALVKKVDDQNAEVKLTVHLEAFEYNVTHTWYVWDSNGTLELLLFTRIAGEIR